MLNEGNLRRIDFNCEEMYAERCDRLQLWNVNSDKDLKWELVFTCWEVWSLKALNFLSVQGFFTWVPSNHFVSNYKCLQMQWEMQQCANKRQRTEATVGKQGWMAGFKIFQRFNEEKSKFNVCVGPLTCLSGVFIGKLRHKSASIHLVCLWKPFPRLPPSTLWQSLNFTKKQLEAELHLVPIKPSLSVTESERSNSATFESFPPQRGAPH